jgi:2-hydroxy-3-oxopropionate reductase
MTKTLGYIGLGAMGAPMVRRLADHHDGPVLGLDANQELLTRVCSETGAEACGSVGQIAARSEVLFTCLPNNDVVRSVYLGPDGVASAIEAGAITIDCSTVGPDATSDVYAGLQEKGVRHLDASMLGSVKQATEGTISFVVGGDDDAFTEARPVLACVGEMIRHVGASGAGNRMKLIHQTLVAGHAVAVAEALSLCLATGTDVDSFYEIVTQGTGFGTSRYFENRVPPMRQGDYTPHFMLKFMLKDARLARDMVPESGDQLPALAAVIETLEQGEAMGFGEDDFSAAMKVLEARVGRTLAPE